MATSKRPVKKSPAASTQPTKALTKELSYNEASARIDEILAKIEEGEVDIDELGGLVKEASELVTLCRGKLHATQVQVRSITKELERDAPEDADEEAE